MSDTISSTTTAEHRNSERALVRRRGWIARTKGEQLRECTVWDESPRGARILVDNSCDFPDTFYFYATLEFTSRQYCRVIWRSERQIGVSFQSVAAPAASGDR
jgi:hypothetical protein